MRKPIFIALFVVFGFASSAQQIGMYSQYMFNEFYINPAVAGTKAYNPAVLSFRRQWAGLNDAPLTQTASVHGKIKDNMGLGGLLFNDETGPMSFAGMQLAWSYHLQVTDKSKLAMGVAGNMFQYVLDKSNLTTAEPDDIALMGGKERSGLQDLSFGLYYFNEKVRLGVSGQQLLQDQMQFNDLLFSEANSLVRHYFAHAGVLLNASEFVVAEPSLFLKMIEPTQPMVDINLKLTYKKTAWLGVSYRDKEALVLMAGFQKNNFKVGYAYDATLSNIKNYSSGSHEVMLGMNLPSWRKKKKETEPSIEVIDEPEEEVID